MGPWGLWPQPALGTTVVQARFVLCSVVFLCSLYIAPLPLHLAPLASSESFPPSRWAVGQRGASASERDTRPCFFWLKKAGSAQGRPKNLPTYLGGVSPSDDKKIRLLENAPKNMENSKTRVLKELEFLLKGLEFLTLVI